MFDEKQPKYLYKYTDLAGINEILNNRTFLCKKPVEFNDPFDMDCYICPNPKKMRARVKKSLLESTSASEFQIDNALDKTNIQESLNTTIQSSGILKEYQERLNRSTVFCMSATYKNILMWSHYSKNHTGIVIRIDLKVAKKFGHITSNAKKVSYSAKKPYFDPDNIEDHMEKTIYSKSIDWQHEEEYRVWIPPQEGEREALRFSHFNSKIIDTLYFGCKTSKEDLEKITGHIKAHRDLSHIQMYKMEKMKPRYELIEKPLLNPVISNGRLTRLREPKIDSRKNSHKTKNMILKSN